MAIFTITGQHPETNEERIMYYDSSVSTLKWEDGTNVVAGVQTKPPPKIPANIQKGKRDLKLIKVQLGLSCNFECEYCSQRFVPNSEETTHRDVDIFVKQMETWFDGGTDGLGDGIRFEWWGGEPFVYWKTMKPLVEAVNARYPNIENFTITNGSMFTKEINEFLVKYNFSVGLSHDGPGQFVRGPNPLDEPKMKFWLVDLLKRLLPASKISFNATLNKKNPSRQDIQLYFEDFIRNELGEEYLQYVNVGEGQFVDAYDEGGMENSLLDEEEDLKFRNNAYLDIRDNKATRFINITEKVKLFIDSVMIGTHKEALPQKCGMDRPDRMAIDLRGNVMTCQNVSAVSNNPSGISHHIGHVSDLENVEIKTATHWSDRRDCPTCPVIHLCRGSCMFLTGDLWEASCNNAFSDNIPMFAVAIEAMSGGYIPIYIDGPQREDRKDIFWWVNGKPENTRKAKKVIPITAI